jgi:hypothetical protein
MLVISYLNNFLTKIFLRTSVSLKINSWVQVHFVRYVPVRYNEVLHIYDLSIHRKETCSISKCVFTVLI